MKQMHYNAAELDPLILFADNHLLAVNKPAALLTQDSGTGRKNLEDWSREWVRVDKQKSGNVFLHAVHRIDKDVSGIVLFARTSKALARLNKEIRTHACKKIYHAWVQGVPSPATAELRHGLIHQNHRAQICSLQTPDAQEARLHYKTLQTKEKRALLEIDLETGRYHQIRAQLAFIGHPILGDIKYGANARSQLGIALQHVQLQINHPTLQKPLKITVPKSNQIGDES